ncbi:MAG: PRC-barrel domain-containing protein [Anaerolineales bacterium]
MDIPLHAEVWSTNRQCGTSNSVIINPITNQITHFVVKEKDFPYEQRLVPVSTIAETTSDTILLKCDFNVFVNMPKFIKDEFIIPSSSGYEDIPQTMLLPYALMLGTITIEHENIPANELAVHRGSQVIAIDGHVGQVDEFLVEPKNGHITHMILTEGHLWGKKDICIPVAKIDHIDKDNVYLKINKSEIEALPIYPIDRPGRT